MTANLSSLELQLRGLFAHYKGPMKVMRVGLGEIWVHFKHTSTDRRAPNLSRAVYVFVTGLRGRTIPHDDCDWLCDDLLERCSFGKFELERFGDWWSISSRDKEDKDHHSKGQTFEEALKMALAWNFSCANEPMCILSESHEGPCQPADVSQAEMVEHRAWVRSKQLDEDRQIIELIKAIGPEGAKRNVLMSKIRELAPTRKPGDILWHMRYRQGLIESVPGNPDHLRAT